MTIAFTIAAVLLVVVFAECVMLWRRRSILMATLDAERAEHAAAVDNLRSANASLDKDLAVLRQRHADDERRLDEFKQLIDTHLKALAGDALNASNTQFLQLADQKLKPIADLLRQYDTHYKQIEQHRGKEYGELNAAALALKSQTESLVTALRRPEVRGRWGEIAMRRIAELAGMTDRCDFTEQTTLDTDAGRLRPDLVVTLPNDRTIVVDSKIVFDAFTDAVRLPEGPERDAKLDLHVEQINTQIKRLCSKPYNEQFDRCPDFVVLFLPIESALYAAVERDGSLLERAMERKVVIATPTLLIALLKTVELGWREKQVADNADEIRALGEELHDRIATALKYVASVGASLGKTVKDYNVLVGSIDTRVIPTTRKFESLGARSAKELPATLEPVIEIPRELTSAESSSDTPS